MNKHTLTRDLGQWLCIRCRKRGERGWIDIQPCVEAVPDRGRIPIVCGETPRPLADVVLQEAWRLAGVLSKMSAARPKLP